MLETTNVRGIYSTSEPYIHFGVGATSVIDSILIIWPNQKKTVRKKVKANQTLFLSMNEAVNSTPKNLALSPPLFSDNTPSFSINFTHQENVFNDYEKQVLLPHKMSQFGPAMTKGDVNNDGLEDVFLGGAMGFSAKLYIQNKDGSFTEKGGEFWQKEKDYEDVDALFVDINGDGFQDLYVVSGGNEFPANDPHYEDRFYLNDGKGNFSKGVVKNINHDSGSIVKSTDYDGDGDLDLFVGGRHIPHQYPMPASSMLLRNDNGQLVNITAKLAPQLNNLGLVTDAVWNDYDLDGDMDLTIVGEWMPIIFFRNENGKLTKAAISGLENSTGWWFGLEKGDFDKDGDMDFIAGNLGLNYKYKTSTKAPFDIYYKDFDGNGNSDIVLGYYNENKHYPLRGFSCSAEQIPSLKQEIQKYDIFASLEIGEVYGNQNLENSLHYKANIFASSYIENLGHGHFKITQLPRLAQLSNLNDFIVSDFNKDGNLDVLAIGNLFVSEIETPRNDAGTGILLLGDGSGNFSPLRTNESGFCARGDAKKMIIIQHNGRKRILIANNGDRLQCFTVE